MVTNRKPTCYVLVGVPASGKSTWAKQQLWFEDCAYVSTDKHIEAYAAAEGKTYSEVFQDFMPTAVKLMVAEVAYARTLGKDIIWDQTSTTIKSRKKKFNMLPDYDMIAIVFETPPPTEHAMRLASRPGKRIPEDVIVMMSVGFEHPTLGEGFSLIRVVG